MRPAFWLVTLLLISSRSIAIEKVGPGVLQGRKISTLNEYSKLPLYVYTTRECNCDPFLVDFSIGDDGSRGKGALRSAAVSITELRLSGVINGSAGRIALFSHGALHSTLTLKGSRLFSSEGQQIKDVQGRILSDGTVRLQQGEKKIIYSLYSAAQR